MHFIKTSLLNEGQIEIIDENQLCLAAIVLNKLQKNICFVKITKSKKRR
jgi:hypothetical protein